MLSYLHAFHAGNHADILKHVALIHVLKKLNEKSAPYAFFDTHAGSGLYSLRGERSLKTGEAQKGILALDAYCRSLECGTDARPKSAAIPAAILDYLEFVRPYLRLDLYPGSPLIERGFLRKGDAHAICELHPKEFADLKENCARPPLFEGRAEYVLGGGDFSANKRSEHGRKFCKTNVLNSDGFKTLLSLTPPKERRGAVLIDPSYEEDSDWEEVSKTAAAVHKKWSAGIMLIWHPLLSRRASQIKKMTEQIALAAKRQNANTSILKAELLVQSPKSHTETSLSENAAQNKETPRLYGSGLIIVNAPWKLDEELDAALNFLCPLLSQKNAESASERPRGVPEEAFGSYSVTKM